MNVDKVCIVVTYLFSWLTLQGYTSHTVLFPNHPQLSHQQRFNFIRSSDICSMASSSTLFKYDVFLSFRGKDVRSLFVPSLDDALRRQGINSFMDKRLKRGNRIDNELRKSIQESRFHIIVFSKNYASSSWCLDELVDIMERHNKREQRAYPLFYDVAPSQVRKQKGPVGDAFARHEQNEAAAKWRGALTEAAALGGWELKPNEDQVEFIKRIVKEISNDLRSVNVYIDNGIIGMKPRVEKVLSFLKTGIKDVRFIGIWGIGGVGKTTLARAVFDKISAKFDGKSFVQDITQITKGVLSGSQWLHNQVNSDILSDDISLKGYEGKSWMNRIKAVGKVLIVLDDVVDKLQIEAILYEPTMFKPGSRIIITSTDEQVLKSCEVKAIYNVDRLTDEEGICLLSRCAFNSDSPTPGYEELSTQIVHYAAGLPLLIKVLGNFLHDRDKLFWEAQLNRLQTIPLKRTLEILKLSYDSLEDDLKEMFLDIACFMRGSKRDDAIRILGSCGFDALFGLQVLEQKSLITISDDNILGMHGPIQEMGRDIVRGSARYQPKRHTRLWILSEIENVLADQSVNDVTKAIAVDDSHVELSSEVITKGFQNVERLRFLRVVSKVEDDYSRCDETIDQYSQNFSCALRYLSWKYYPYLSLPRRFQANDLVALEMSDCRISQLWGSEERKVPVLNSLRFLDLSRSKLRKLNLELMPNLEKLDLEECCDLGILDTRVGCLKRLVSLNLNGCKYLESFSFIKLLESLEVLYLDRLSLKKFPDVIPEHRNSSLLELRFRCNDVEELPSSIKKFRKLEILDLDYCGSLRSLPDSICRLRHLKHLKLHCRNLEKLPADIGCLKNLEKLDLSQTRVKDLPDSISMLIRLETLDLTSCDLESLPKGLGQLKCLENLILTECTRVKDIPDGICELERLKHFSVFKCVEVKKLPEELGLLKHLEVLNIKETQIRRLPPSISSLESLKIYADERCFQLHNHVSPSGILKASSSARKRKFHQRYTS